MFVPAPPSPVAAPMPLGFDVAAASSALTAPSHTKLKVWRHNLNVLEGSRASVTGVLRDGARNPLGRRAIVLQGLDHGRWHTLSRTRTNASGRFVLRYMPRRLRSELVRVRFGGDTLDRATSRRVGRLNVYHLAGASWYGGGGGLACGGSLTDATLGVANKTLPCGTLVTLRYGARTVRVPVIDRGPYVAGREYDLTVATKAALGFGDTGDVWATR
jgi:peptidoglycan lytic transglycosylase